MEGPSKSPYKVAVTRTTRSEHHVLLAVGCNSASPIPSEVWEAFCPGSGTRNTTGGMLLLLVCTDWEKEWWVGAFSVTAAAGMTPSSTAQAGSSVAPFSSPFSTAVKREEAAPASPSCSPASLSKTVALGVVREVSCRETVEATLDASANPSVLRAHFPSLPFTAPLHSAGGGGGRGGHSMLPHQGGLMTWCGRMLAQHALHQHVAPPPLLASAAGGPASFANAGGMAPPPLSDGSPPSSGSQVQHLQHDDPGLLMSSQAVGAPSSQMERRGVGARDLLHPHQRQGGKRQRGLNL